MSDFNDDSPFCRGEEVDMGDILEKENVKREQEAIKEGRAKVEIIPEPVYLANKENTITLEADIFYRGRVDHRASKAEADILYWSEGIARRYTPLPIGVFKRYWRKMPVHEKIIARIGDLHIEQELDRFFEKYNISGRNPLTSSENQQFIRENRLHTSMSVGDIIKVYNDWTTVFYIVAPEGFVPITLI